jgi:hypothetical protein
MKVEKQQGAVLLQWARARIREELGGGSAKRPEGEWCERLAATFITLRWADDGRLQGCIGGLEPKRALADDVAHSAVAAALLDPRTDPISLSDVGALDVELSILSPLEPIAFTDEASALAAIRPEVDGIVFRMRGRRATFLPSMWPRLPTVREFMAALKEKAGFSRDAWGPDVTLARYTVDKHVDRAS